MSFTCSSSHSTVLRRLELISLCTSSNNVSLVRFSPAIQVLLLPKGLPKLPLAVILSSVVTLGLLINSASLFAVCNGLQNEPVFMSLTYEEQQSLRETGCLFLDSSPSCKIWPTRSVSLMTQDFCCVTVCCRSGIPLPTFWDLFPGTSLTLAVTDVFLPVLAAKILCPTMLGDDLGSAEGCVLSEKEEKVKT